MLIVLGRRGKEDPGRRFFNFELQIMGGAHTTILQLERAVIFWN
jgi:hypothetical protein